MTCAWKELMDVLPPGLREQVRYMESDGIQEIRLRLGQVPELVFGNKSTWLKGLTTCDDLNFCINSASRYSPWATRSMECGYLTSAGGHRIGVCGEVVIKNGAMTGIRTVSSLCIRVARDFQNIGEFVASRSGSLLIIGPPGSGKTTLLRDLIRCISTSSHVGVVDERGELFPTGFNRGSRVDVMTGCTKAHGIEILLRTMGPDVIAVDEITAQEDCKALVQAWWCGVSIVATAHAGSVRDLRSRPLYKPIVDSGLFDHVFVMGRDKSWREERLYG